MRLATLFQAPEVNPITHKARSIPLFNVINLYGRVFFFSWFGFFVAFWSWYAFPPLVSQEFVIMDIINIVFLGAAFANTSISCTIPFKRTST